MISVLVLFSVAVIKSPAKAREKRVYSAYSSRLWSIIVGKASLVSDAVSHITVEVGERMDAPFLLLSSPPLPF